MDKKIEIISASQILLFKQCPRLWFNRYISGEKTPVTDAMNAGLDVHLAIEELLKTGSIKSDKWKNVVKKIQDEIVKLDLTNIDGFKEGVFSEHRVTLRTEVGPMFLGSMDIFDARGEIPIIYDIKSKGNLDYVLNEFQIEQDIQLAIYALWTMETKKISNVQIVHIYVLRDENNPIIKIVSSNVNRDQVEKVWQNVFEIVQKMITYANEKDSLQFPGNKNSCFAYGKPCHYINRCEPESPLIGLRVQKKSIEEDKMSLIDELREAKALANKRTVANIATPYSDKQMSFPSILPPDAPPRTTSVEAPVTAPAAETKVKLAKVKLEKKTKSELFSSVEENSTFLLYVKCSPYGKDVLQFQNWVSPIEIEVAAKHRVSHWGMIEYHASAILADAMKNKLDTLPKEMVMFGNEPAAGIFKSLLPPNTQLVMGF